MSKRRYGDQRACKYCGFDIEWHGREHGWHDRGGNIWCDTSGAAYRDENGISHRYPHRRHTATADR